MTKITLPDSGGTRLEAVDALRGWALFAIVILHCIEHYNLFCIPSNLPDLLLRFDRFLFDMTFFILGGNAYATFSLLFGFSFFIQMRNARRRGNDFRWRFAWRMLLLACFAILHSLFYNGDILLLYAVCGLVLIPASSLNNRTNIIIAVILMLQPLSWIKVIYAAINPDYVSTDSLFMPYAIAAEEIGRNGNIIQTLSSNLRDGILYSNLWQIESGRIFLTPALFLTGMLLGRLNLFERSDLSIKFWKKVLWIGLIAVVPLYILKTYIPPLFCNPTIITHYNVAMTRIMNASTTAILVSIFIICWFSKVNGFKLQRMLIPYGRMSLTNYICQSIIGVTIFYHCGLGLYDKTGASACVIIAIIIVTLQSLFSCDWLKHHKQGPLEYIWKRLTWMRFRQ
ncbi:MAG: DUF418 domain-containing protein [Muribaculaceae bacterium]|nr:DUF418 domain-containing protein [Muribaculaceae bacterium]